MEINVLQVLDEMDKYRRDHQNEKISPPDYCMRVMEAIVAKAAGYKSRNGWTDALKADKSTEYSKYANQQKNRKDPGPQGQGEKEKK